jgi:hypothetical protein
MMDVLSSRHEEEDYWPAAKLALLLYGRGRVPEQTESLAKTYMNYVQTEFNRMRRDSRSVFQDRTLSDDWAAYAEGLLDYYNQLMDLEGIIVGSERMKRVPYNNRFGVPMQYLNDLKKIKKQDW